MAIHFQELGIGFIFGAIAVYAIVTILFRRRFGRELATIREALQNEQNARMAAETRLQERTRSWEESTKTLKETFNSIAHTALQSNNQAFLDLAQQSFTGFVNQSRGDLEKRQEAIAHLVSPLKESLDKHEMLTRQVEKETKETFGSIRNYMDSLKESQNLLAKEASSLSSALKSPKTRGRWGEIGLRRIVEFCGMNSYCDFTEQQSVQDGENRLRPDMIVHLPGNRRVIIDSKVPLNAYLESVEQENEEIQRECYKRHAASVRDHFKRLSAKTYWAQFDNVVDFVILYIEIESAFGVALSMDNQLVLDAMEGNIIFATPTTLLTLLRTIAFSWKQHEMTDNARRIAEAGIDLYERARVFADHLQAMGKGIEGAVRSYNAAIGSWENRIIPGVRRFRELGAYSDKKELNHLEEIELTVREAKSSGNEE